MRKAPLQFFMIIISVLPAWAAKVAETSSATPPSIAEYFQIYMLNEDRRSSQDKVVISGQGTSAETAMISYWRSLKTRDPADEICNAYKWLLFGRGQYGHGATDAFERFPTLRKIYIRLFDVEFGTRLGQKTAEILPTQRVIPYLRVGVDKSSLQGKKTDWNKVKEEMNKSETRCAELGNALMDDRWFDKEYLTKGKPTPAKK